MDLTRLGADVRLLRRRKGWSQAKLGAAAGVGRWSVSEIERGRAGALTLDTVGAIVVALGAAFSARIFFHGEALDRLRDREHARIVERVVERLIAAGWEVATEATFNVFGERGAIDVLAYHPVTRMLLVVEVKSVIPDIGAMLATLDRKVRLAREIAEGRGWVAASVSRLLVVRETSTARRRVAEQARTFSIAFPMRGREVVRWFLRPSQPMSGIWFLSSTVPTRSRSTRRAKPTSPRADPRSLPRDLGR